MEYEGFIDSNGDGRSNEILITLHCAQAFTGRKTGNFEPLPIIPNDVINSE
jgi:hypothetical protein